MEEFAVEEFTGSRDPTSSVDMGEVSSNGLGVGAGTTIDSHRGEVQ